MRNAILRARQTQCCDPVIDGVLGGLIQYAERLEAALLRNRKGYLNILEMRKLSLTPLFAEGRYGALTREEIEAVVAEIDKALAK